MISTDHIQQCIHREQRALQQCYEICAPYLYTIVKSYIYNSEVQKDVLQNSFIEIFSSLENFDTSRPFKPWIAKITVYQCIKQLRSMKKLNLFVPLDSDTTHIEIAEQETILSQLSQNDILNLLEMMPEGYRTIFLMNRIDGYSHKEISDMIGISVGTSRSQLNRSLKWIKKHLSHELTAIQNG